MLLFGGDFLSITPVVFIWAMVLQKFPVMFLFRPCAQSSSIEYLICPDLYRQQFCADGLCIVVEENIIIFMNGE